MKHRSWAQACERACCNILIYFPLLFVHGVSTWALWTLVNLEILESRSLGSISIFFGVVFWALLNWSYSTAVFTPPGSPQTSSPSNRSSNGAFDPEELAASSVTVKADGSLRYCKKCQCLKPDRTHHCSTCRTCVLKMDHHCPWLATCVGLRNYKPFVLFCVYTSLFAWVCFLGSVGWMLEEVFGVDPSKIGRIGERTEAMMVHFVVLSVISGIIGLVISGFSAYHIYLTTRNRTTLESMEKTRYLSPLKTMVAKRLSQNGRPYSGEDEGQYRYNGNILGRQSFGDQLREMGTALTELHANALPGVLRPEEGEEDQEMGLVNGGRPQDSPAMTSLRRYLNDDVLDDEERQYSQYLDDRDNARLPNAFDLGWKRNIIAVLGPNPWLWVLPICNSEGDGWIWPKSELWARRREEMRWDRERDFRDRRGEGHHDADIHAIAPWRAPPSKRPDAGNAQEYDDSSDEEDDERRQQKRLLKYNERQQQSNGERSSIQNWNDVPDEILFGQDRRR